MSCMFQALVFLNGFADVFLIKSQDVILHSLPDDLAGLNIFEIVFSGTTSLYHSSLLLSIFVLVNSLSSFSPWWLPATRRAAFV